MDMIEAWIGRKWSLTDESFGKLRKRSKEDAIAFAEMSIRDGYSLVVASCRWTDWRVKPEILFEAKKRAGTDGGVEGTGPWAPERWLPMRDLIDLKIHAAMEPGPRSVREVFEVLEEDDDIDSPSISTVRRYMTRLKYGAIKPKKGKKTKGKKGPSVPLWGRKQ